MPLIQRCGAIGKVLKLPPAASAIQAVPFGTLMVSNTAVWCTHLPQAVSHFQAVPFEAVMVSTNAVSCNPTVRNK